MKAAQAANRLGLPPVAAPSPYDDYSVIYDINKWNSSGFANPFKDDIGRNPNGDQTHHMITAFALGYSFGSSLCTSGMNAYEDTQRPDSQSNADRRINPLVCSIGQAFGSYPGASGGRGGYYRKDGNRFAVAEAFRQAFVR